jgi:hypothetical protein
LRPRLTRIPASATTGSLHNRASGLTLLADLKGFPDVPVHGIFALRQHGADGRANECGPSSGDMCRLLLKRIASSQFLSCITTMNLD